MKKYTLLLALVLMSPLAHAEITDSYNYVEASVGSFFNGSPENPRYPEGNLPVYLKAGHVWEFGKKLHISVEYTHRSNLDIGWPFGTAGEHEYNRDGAFVSFRYKFR